MSNKNHFSFIGNLTHDPEVRQTTKGTSVCNVRLALNRTFKSAGSEELTKEVTFVDIAIWGSKGEAFARHHKKGQVASIDGRIKMDTWIDKKTQEERSQLKGICEEWYWTSGASAGTPAGDPEPF